MGLLERAGFAFIFRVPLGVFPWFGVHIGQVIFGAFNEALNNGFLVLFLTIENLANVKQREILLGSAFEKEIREDEVSQASVSDGHAFLDHFGFLERVKLLDKFQRGSGKGFLGLGPVHPYLKITLN